MRIDAAIHRRRALSLTSLIDVIFLLLLFFMLSSTFTRFASIEMAGGKGGAGAASAKPDVLIRLHAEAWSVNGTSLAPDDAAARLRQLQDAGATSAVILVRGDVTSQMLVGAVERIRRDTDLAVSVTR